MIDVTHTGSLLLDGVILVPDFALAWLMRPDFPFEPRWSSLFTWPRTCQLAPWIHISAAGGRVRANSRVRTRSLAGGWLRLPVSG